MLKLRARTNIGEERIEVPNCFEELTVKQFQQLVREWDGKDWIKAFSILSGKEYNSIAESKDYSLEGTLYASVQFLFDQPMDFEALPVPQFIVIGKDSLQVPKKIGRLSIGQTIQARNSISGMKDVRAGISIVTAIYLQPLIDNKPFNFDRAVEIEQDILQMPIVKIFPVGFFLLTKLKASGNLRVNVWHRLLKMLRIESKGPEWQRSKDLNSSQT